MKEGDIVELIYFNGLTKPQKRVKKEENFWILIGARGVIVKDPSQKELYASFSINRRYLVRFDKDVKSLGLVCHNSVKNTLWILATDLGRTRTGQSPKRGQGKIGK